MPIQLSPILAVAVTPESSAGEIIVYQTVGFIVVLVALALLAVIISMLGKFFRTAPKTAATTSKTAPAKPAAPTVTLASDAIPDHIIAVIAAAVAVEMGQRHQIVAVTHVGSNWSMEGRRSIYSSHTLRRR